MPDMCHCKRDFVRPGRCCCVHCDNERAYDEYYRDNDVPRQGSGPKERIVQPRREYRRTESETDK